MLKALLKLIIPKKGLLLFRAAKLWMFEPEIRILKYLCDKKKISIDIGAYLGVVTFFLKRYSKECHVFEPNPELANYLDGLFSGDINVKVECYAISEKKGEAELSYPVVRGKELSARSSIDSEYFTDKYKVRTFKAKKTTLSELNLKNVGFIKIDVEGHELSVLKGAISLINRNFPSILVEVEERHKRNTIKEVFKFMKDLKYIGFFFLNDKLHSIDKFNIKVHQNPENICFGKIKKNKIYINNFIFIKQKDIFLKLLKFIEPTERGKLEVVYQRWE